MTRLARFLLLLLLATFALTVSMVAQTSGTGAISGTVADPSGAVVPDTKITVTNQGTGATVSVVSTRTGNYLVPLLPPGRYTVKAEKESFKVSLFTDISVRVTETASLNINLEVGAQNQTVQVDAAAEQLQTESSALGHVTTGEMVENLPLVTRNYTQILGLSPGITADVTNAGALGRGTGSDGEQPIVAGGATGSDNNFQMNGAEINDLQGTQYYSGGVAVPNPDTIQEFKVQTGQYDASYGRNAGANVDVVTKGGTNRFHGTLFEFFRNEALNANEYFRKLNGQPRQVLRQNQYGFTLGGPIKKDKLFFFLSYQGTRQRNGIDPNCSTSMTLPPLTNDRSPATLGQEFAGQPGLFGGTAVAADGSNIAPQALALLQYKLPDGSYLIPTPQRLDTVQGQTVGFSSVSSPCPYNEEQFMTNSDWVQSNKSKFSERFFFSNSHDSRTLSTNNFGTPTAPGFPFVTTDHFRNFSLSHTYIFTPSLLNQAEVSYHRQFVYAQQQELFRFSDIGVTVPSFDNNIPLIDVSGNFVLGANGQSVQFAQNFYNVQDDLVWTKGSHSLHFGGGVDRGQLNTTRFHYVGELLFLSFPDFLLGQDGTTNGSGISNIFASVDLPGAFDRYWRTWDYNFYAQDNYKVTSRLTLNLGLRFEHLGALADILGRNASFDMSAADPNPPAAGSLQGFVVSKDYPGPVPPGVIQLDNNYGYRGDGQSTFSPRVGFAWQLPGTQRMVLRGGWGMYHQRLTGQPLFQLLINQPFALIRSFVAVGNSGASFGSPFPPIANPTFPSFTPYSPTTQLASTTFAQNFRPPLLQNYSLNLQTQLAHDLILEVGYLGTRGTHLLRQIAPNQAALASPSNPIRGETTNTIDNIALRAPLLGWSTSGYEETQSAGASWYNAGTASLNKRFSHGLQFLASYTYARDLTTEPYTSIGANGGFAIGNQFDPNARYGPDSYIREHRLVVSYSYDLPFFKDQSTALGKILGGWRAAGVTIFQSGHLLPVTNSNAFNVYGISGFGQDFAQLSSSCTLGDVNTPGSVTGKLNNYIKTSCFENPPVIGDDGVATAFGNTRPGIIHGPDQRNTDLAIVKTFRVPWPNEKTTLDFRAELFNAFNTPQFADPNTELDSGPAFGTIINTVGSPRIIQLALKLSF